MSAEKWLWMPDENEAWIAAKVISNDGKSAVLETREGHTFSKPGPEASNFPTAQLSTLDRNYDNLVLLEEFSEGAIVHQLRERYRLDKIYTNIGTILVSINPFKMLPIYTPNVLSKYKSRDLMGSRDPHVFQTASSAYWDFMNDKVNQSVVISGESGSGKTEATKLILQFLSDIAGSTTGVERQIMSSNPILEAFGNSKTLRNNNSSRFGKWMEILFEKNGIISGARIVNYLLEKSRVVEQTKAERNYHIFYQMLSGADESMKSKYKLRSPVDYDYLSQSGCIGINGVDDKQEFSITLKSLEELQFTAQEIENIWQILSGILILGNLKFEKDGDGSNITNTNDLDEAASLLLISSETLRNALCFRAVTIRNEVQMIKQLVHQAVDARDSLSKALYGNLFDWLVHKINLFLCKSSSENTIGVLDIFGFEVFEKNSFEQFCINFANEKLQQHFNQYIFKMEQNEYIAEGINIESIPFIDNQECLDLIEGKPGLIRMLDEEVVLPRGSDISLVEKLHRTFSDQLKHKFYDRKRTTKELFIINHYAGPVSYDIRGFVDKNKDNIYDSLLNAITSSQCPLIVNVFKLSEMSAVDLGATSPGKSSKAKTLGTKFKNQLQSLLNALNQTAPNFIRCIKPNHPKLPDTFDAPMILRQMKYAGLFEAIRVRASGFSYRKLHDSFYNRYKILLPKNDRVKVEKVRDVIKTCQRIVSLVPNFPSEDLQFGKTKIFYRNTALLKLEEQRDSALSSFAVRLQTCTRAIFARQLKKNLKILSQKITKSIGNASLAEMEDALNFASDKNLELFSMTQLRDVYNKLKEEERIIKLLENAINVKEIDPLEGAIKQAEKVSSKSAKYNEILQAARLLMDQLTLSEQCKKKLKEAILSENLEELLRGIQEAKRIKLSHSIVQEAENLVQRLNADDVIFARLQKAVSDFDMPTMLTNIALCADMSMDTPGRVSVLDQAYGHIEKHFKTIIEENISSNNADSLENVFKEIESFGLLNRFSDLIAKAKERASFSIKDHKFGHFMSMSSKDKSELQQKLREAIKNNDLDMIESILPSMNDLGGIGKSKTIKLGRHLIDTQRASALISFNLRSALEDLDVDRMKKYLAEHREANLEVNDMITEARRICFEMSQEEILSLQFKTFIHRNNLNRVRELIREAVDNESNQEDVRRAREFLSVCFNDTGNDRISHRRISSTFKVSGQIDLSEQLERLKGLYPFSEFSKLRHESNYVKRLFFNKKETSRQMLVWQKDPIPRSLVYLSVEYCGSKAKAKQMKQLAVNIFKNLLGFMRDRYYAYPANLAVELLTVAVNEPLLRDEIYCQLIKQTTQNPSVESLLLGWKLIYLALTSFAPSSTELENVLLCHIAEAATPLMQKHMDFDSVENIASNCWMALFRLKDFGPRAAPLTVEEIREFTESKAPPLIVWVSDTEFVELPISITNRSMTVKGVSTLIANRGDQPLKVGRIQIEVEDPVDFKREVFLADPNDSILSLMSYWEGEKSNYSELTYKFKYVDPDEIADNGLENDYEEPSNTSLEESDANILGKLKVYVESDDIVEVAIPANHPNMSIKETCEKFIRQLDKHSRDGKLHINVRSRKDPNVDKTMVLDPKMALLGIISHWESECNKNPDLIYKFCFSSKDVAATGENNGLPAENGPQLHKTLPPPPGDQNKESLSNVLTSTSNAPACPSNLPIPPPAPPIPAAPQAPSIPAVPQAPSIPAAPQAPPIPAAPQAPPIPAAPAVPIAPKIPDAPAVPIAPPIPAAPQAPSVPAAPAVPIAPKIPAAPAVPVAPKIPAAPLAPKIPAAPLAPKIPAAPAVPIAPKIPTAPAVPIAPKIPTAPAVPVAPKIPAAPAVPVAPKIPAAPAVSVAPKIPAAPAAPVAPLVPKAPLSPGAPKFNAVPAASKISDAGNSGSSGDRTDLMAAIRGGVALRKSSDVSSSANNVPRDDMLSAIRNGVKLKKVSDTDSNNAGSRPSATPKSPQEDMFSAIRNGVKLKSVASSPKPQVSNPVPKKSLTVQEEMAQKLAQRKASATSKTSITAAAPTLNSPPAPPKSSIDKSSAEKPDVISQLKAGVPLRKSSTNTNSAVKPVSEIKGQSNMTSQTNAEVNPSQTTSSHGNIGSKVPSKRLDSKIDMSNPYLSPVFKKKGAEIMETLSKAGLVTSSGQIKSSPVKKSNGLAALAAAGEVTNSSSSSRPAWKR